MIVRQATQDDVAALSSCLAAAYAPFLDLGLPPVTDGVAEDIAQHDVWVAIIQDAVVGGVVLGLGNSAHVINLAVHPVASGQGVGRALLVTARARAVAAGFTTLQLATHVGMNATQAFYLRSGWSETGREGNKVYFECQLA